MKNNQAVNNTFFYFFANEIFESSKPIPVNDFFQMSNVDFLIELDKFYQVVFDAIMGNENSIKYAPVDIRPFFSLAANVFIEFLELQAKETNKLDFSFPDINDFQSSLAGTFKTLL